MYVCVYVYVFIYVPPDILKDVAVAAADEVCMYVCTYTYVHLDILEDVATAEVCMYVHEYVCDVCR